MAQMNSRLLQLPFNSARFIVRPIGNRNQSSTRRHCFSTPSRTSASRTESGGKSGCGLVIPPSALSFTTCCRLGGGRSNGGGGGGRGRGDQPGGDEWLPGISLMAASFAAHALLRAPFGIAAEKDAVEGAEDSWDWLGPMLTSLGFSGLLGFASGAAFKLIGRMVAVSIGLFLVFLQVPHSFLN